MPLRMYISPNTLDMPPKKRSIEEIQPDRDRDRKERVEILHLLENRQGSYKFYELSILERSTNNYRVFSRYGRIGTNGATVYKDVTGRETAMEHVSTLLAQKLSKGYKEVPIIPNEKTNNNDFNIGDINDESSDSDEEVNQIYELDCAHCTFRNSEGSSTCEICGMSLTVVTRKEVETLHIKEEEEKLPKLQKSGRIYLECNVETQSKFHEFIVTNDDHKAKYEVTSRYGRIGSNGATSKKKFKGQDVLYIFIQEKIIDLVDKSYEIIEYDDALQEFAAFSNVTKENNDHDSTPPVVPTEDNHSSSSSSSSSSNNNNTTIEGRSNNDTFERVYLECTQGNSSKFYELSRIDSGLRLRVRYGKIGSDGVPSEKSFSTLAEMTKFIDRTTREKINKGYKIIRNAVNSTSTTSTSTTTSGSSNDTAEYDTFTYDETNDNTEFLSAALEAGQRVFVKGNSRLPYTIKKFNGGYSCTCQGFIIQIRRKGIQATSCKHIKLIRGEENERIRCEESTPSAAGQSSGGSAGNNKKNTSIPGKIALAQQWKSGTNPTGMVMSEKLDGMRAYWHQNTLWTRNGLPIIAPDYFIEGLPRDIDLDGELFLGRGKFDECMSIARRGDGGGDWHALKYLIFDAPTIRGGIMTRLAGIRDLISDERTPFAAIHPQTICKSEEHLLEELARVEALGGEGLMLRNANANHRSGRNSDLLKVKTFHDDEALVVDYEKGKGKYEGQIGSLVCMTRAGNLFKVGSGLNDTQRDRKNAPKLHTVITFKYFELTKDNIPRFPIFMRERPDVSIDEFPKIPFSINI